MSRYRPSKSVTCLGYKSGGGGLQPYIASLGMCHPIVYAFSTGDWSFKSQLTLIHDDLEDDFHLAH